MRKIIRRGDIVKRITQFCYKDDVCGTYLPRGIFATSLSSVKSELVFLDNIQSLCYSLDLWGDPTMHMYHNLQIGCTTSLEEFTLKVNFLVDQLRK